MSCYKGVLGRKRQRSKPICAFHEESFRAYQRAIGEYKCAFVIAQFNNVPTCIDKPFPDVWSIRQIPHDVRERALM